MHRFRSIHRLLLASLRVLLRRSLLRSSGSLLAVRVMLILLVMLYSISHTGRVQAATFTIGCVGGVGDAVSLQASIPVINANNQADTVNLVAGCTYTLTATLSITADNGNALTINGNGAIISGNNTLRVFSVNSGANVTLDNLTVSNGRTNSFGGGGIENYGTLVVTNSTFSGNSSLNWAGAIDNQGVLTVTNSTFSANWASVYGGAIYSEGTAMVTNSTFSGNSASSGGAIYSEGTVAVMNSTFSGNLATNGDGAGVENFGTLTVTNSTFSGNTATFSGGGIDNFGTLRLTNSTFSGNSANTGGGIYNNVTATLYNNIIANSTSGGDCVQAGGTLTVGVNLIGDGSCNATISGNPSLGTLQNNGGPTQTFALNAGSPAIDAGDSTALSEATTVVDYNGDGDTTDTIQFDQRGTGFPRVQGSRVDLGAVEVQCAGSPYNVLAGDVSGLIAAINCANSTPANDEINLTNSTYTLTAVNNSDGGAGDNGLPGILSAGTAGTLTINGNGAIIERNAIPSFRLMYIDSGANLTLDNLTLRGGRGSGGGVLQQGYGEPAKRYTLQ